MGHTSCVARMKFEKVHGHTHPISPTYKSWDSMKSRCTNPNDPSFGRYGRRGIKVHPDWFRFENFLTDMGERPSNLTLERAHNDEYYGPLNCVWSTRKEQAQNRSNSHLVTIGSVTKCLTEWCEQYGIEIALVRWRMKHSCATYEEALSRPIRPKAKQKSKK